MNEKETLNEILNVKNLDNLKNKFFSISQELFLIAEIDGPIKWLNPAWEFLLGYSSDDLLNKSFFDLIHPLDLELTKNRLYNISKGKSSPGTELRIKNKIGKYKWFLWNANVYLEQNLIFALGKDITLNKENEDELRLLKSLVFAFNKLANLEQSLNITLKEICQFTEWPYGEAWIQENNTLIRLTSWHIETEEIKQFFEDTKDYKSKPGQGLIGTAWLSKKSIWVENLKEEKKFLRASYLKNSGLNSYFLVPILSNQEVIAALAFFQYSSNPANKKLINLLTTIADHLGALIDHKNIEERLIQNEKLISEIEKIASTGNWEIDFKKEKFFWSDGLFSIYGMEPTKNIDIDDVTNRIHPDDRSKILSNLDKVLKEKTPFVVEYKIIRSDGNIRNLISKGGILQMEDGTVTKMVGITQDVTAQKEAEINLQNSHEQLKRLSAHLQSAREEERTRIAREIHDELGQSLTGLKMDLAWIEKKYNSNESDNNLITDKIKSMSQLIDSTIITVRKISSELRPGVLDYLGLPAAIEWQAQDFQNRTGIKCKINSLPADLNIIHELSTAVFRIFQETLTNVARHSNANKVDISLSNYNNHLVLEVEDNGKGITEAEIQNLRSFGLLGMRERTEMFGGEFKIFGSKKGTTIIVQIPLYNIMGDI